MNGANKPKKNAFVQKKAYACGMVATPLSPTPLSATVSCVRQFTLTNHNCHRRIRFLTRTPTFTCMVLPVAETNEARGHLH
jgi:hypothetical protein